MGVVNHKSIANGLTFDGIGSIQDFGRVTIDILRSSTVPLVPIITPETPRYI